MAGNFIQAGIGLRQNQKVNPQVILASKLLAVNSINGVQTVNQILQNNVFFEPIPDNAVDIDQFISLEQGPETSKEASMVDDMGYKMQGDGNAIAEEMPMDRNKHFTSHIGFIESVEEQLQSINFTEDQKLIAHYLIASVDDKGMIPNVKELYQFIHDQTSWDINTIGSVHQTLKESIKPTGLFTANIQESIQMQVNGIPNERTREHVRHVVNNHYTQFLKRDFEGIAKAMGLSSNSRKAFETDIVNNLNRIKRYPVELNSSTAATSALTMNQEPDFIVGTSNKSIQVRTSGNTMAKIEAHLLTCLRNTNIHGQTLEKLKSSKQNPEAIAYYQRQLEELKNVKETIHHTEKMKLAFIKNLLEHQHKFAETKDLNDLIPTMQKDFVVDNGPVRLHASQISSMVQSATIQMEDGSTFQLKDLFSRGFQTESGIRISEGEVKGIIQKLIAEEPISKPLSDLVLTKLLIDEGINIRKEKVVALREEMDMPDYKHRLNAYLQASITINQSPESQLANPIGNVSSKDFEKTLESGVANIFINGEKKTIAFQINEMDESNKLSLWEVDNNGRLDTTQSPLIEISQLKELRELMKPNNTFEIKTEQSENTISTSPAILRQTVVNPDMGLGVGY
jgi:RNA polymerase sigma-54 factor